MIIYGIKNCDTVKKTLRWLQDHHIDFEFHDFKVNSITGQHLKNWSKQVGWQKLINTKGTTYRELSDEEKSAIKDESSAIEVMLQKTSIIKRPVVEKDGQVIQLGFNEQEYGKIFLESTSI